MRNWRRSLSRSCGEGFEKGQCCGGLKWGGEIGGVLQSFV